jgi:hypothetical protein
MCERCAALHARSTAAACFFSMPGSSQESIVPSHLYCRRFPTPVPRTKLGLRAEIHRGHFTTPEPIAKAATPANHTTTIDQNQFRPPLSNGHSRMLPVAPVTAAAKSANLGCLQTGNSSTILFVEGVSAMSEVLLCPICRNADPGSPNDPTSVEDDKYLTNDGNLRVTCPRCGSFVLHHMFVLWTNDDNGMLEQTVAVGLSAYLRAETDAGKDPNDLLVTAENCDRLASLGRRAIDPDATIDQLLLEVADRTTYLFDETPAEASLVWVARLALRGLHDLGLLLQLVGSDLGVVDHDGSGQRIIVQAKELQLPQRLSFTLTQTGWRRVHEIRRVQGSGRIAFIAMPFASEFDAVRDAIATAIRRAGYEPLRVDEDEFTEGVMDRIIARIRESKFVVADFTNNRGGVYYEAGIARGLGIRTINVCDGSCLPDDAEPLRKLHFDVRHLNLLAWQAGDLQTFERRLQARIEALFGKGPVRRPEAIEQTT